MNESIRYCLLFYSVMQSNPMDGFVESYYAIVAVVYQAIFHLPGDFYPKYSALPILTCV
jgi:hypothetical protein